MNTAIHLHNCSTNSTDTVSNTRPFSHLTVVLRLFTAEYTVCGNSTENTRKESKFSFIHKTVVN